MSEKSSESKAARPWEAVHAELVVVIGQLLQASNVSVCFTAMQKSMIRNLGIIMAAMPVPEDDGEAPYWCRYVQARIAKLMEYFDTPAAACTSPEWAALNKLRGFSYQLGNLHGTIIAAREVRGEMQADRQGKGGAR